MTTIRKLVNRKIKLDPLYVVDANNDAYWELECLLRDDLKLFISSPSNIDKLSKKQLRQLITLCSSLRPMALHSIFYKLSLELN